MRFAKVMLLSILAAITGLAGSCKNGGTPGDFSLLELRRADGTVLSSQEGGRGSIEIAVLEQFDVDVFLIEHHSGTTQEFEVTADTDFNFTNTSVAGVTSAGLVTGLEAGTTRMVATYRVADPTATDKIDLDVTVI
jgi:hypothetical protein